MDETKRVQMSFAVVALLFLLIFTANQIFNMIRARSLIVYYDFEDDFENSNLVLDKSGNHNDIRVFGSARKDAGFRSGSSAFFSRGSSVGGSYLSLGRNPTKNFNQITVSLWFKTENPAENYKLAGTAWWRGGPGNGWLLGTHYPELWDTNNTGIRLSSVEWKDVTHFFIPNEWNHLAITYDRNRLKEYINGELVVDHTTSGKRIGNGSGNFEIGRWTPFTAYDYYGLMDEFRIYNRALSGQEIKELARR